MNAKMKVGVVIALASLITMGVQAQNIVTGNLWHVPEATSQNAIPGNVPGSTPDVTFEVNAPFNFSADTATVGAWLATGSAYNIVENTAGTLASRMDDGTGVTGTLLDFRGLVTVTSGQTFTVTHDDGLTLVIGGLTVINTPGPTPPTTDTVTYTGPSGTFNFELVYGECCGGPAVLQIDLPLQSVPDGGSTLALLGGALSLLGVVYRKFRK